MTDPEKDSPFQGPPAESGSVISGPGGNTAAGEDSLNERLARCAEATHFSPHDLRRMAVHSLLTQFEQSGKIALFFDLNPHLSEAERGAIERRAEAADVEPSEYLTALVRAGVQRMVAERAAQGRGEAVIPISEENADTLTLFLRKEGSARLEAHAAALGCDAGNLAAVLVEVMAGLETPEEKPKPNHSLTLTAGQSRRMERAAKLLEVNPHDFLRWQLGDLLENLEDPTHGLLVNWADDMIVYDTPEQKARVQRNVNAWLARRAKRTAQSASAVEGRAA